MYNSEANLTLKECDTDIFHDSSILEPPKPCDICHLKKREQYVSHPKKFKVVRKLAHHYIRNHQEDWEKPIVKSKLSKLDQIRRGRSQK